MFEKRLLVDWKGLKALGWPYSRAHTYRMVLAGIFPAPMKFGDHPSARVAWRMKDVIDFLEANGMPLDDFDGNDGGDLAA